LSLIFQAIILGVIQGLTEFFPISSSAHLVIFQHFFSIKKNVVLLDSVLHAGTLLAIILLFWKEILEILESIPSLFKKDKMDREGVKLFYLIFAGTIPTAIIGALFKREVESAFLLPKLSGGLLLFTSLILFLTKFTREKSEAKITHAFIIGIFQGLALLPGISRSGVTIASALAIGWKREYAFKFSFLLSIPAVLGANILEIYSSELSGSNLLVLISGFIFSFIFGYLSLKILSPIVKKGKFYLFSIYCLIIGLGILVFL